METARKVPLTDDFADETAARLVQFCRGASQACLSFEMGHDTGLCCRFRQFSLSYVDLHTRLPSRLKPLLFKKSPVYGNKAVGQFVGKNNICKTKVNSECTPFGMCGQFLLDLQRKSCYSNLTESYTPRR